ncbi:MAG: hypothetical protein AB7F21_02945 [Desulfuromonadales bacterium]
MPRTRALLAVCACAGLIGAFVVSLLLGVLPRGELIPTAEFLLHDPLSPEWLYPRLFRGGAWALLFFVTVASPRRRRHWIRKALWVSLVPAAWQLLYVFPQLTPYGLFGLQLGITAPFFVLLIHLIWGFLTGLFARLLWGRP